MPSSMPITPPNELSQKHDEKQAVQTKLSVTPPLSDTLPTSVDPSHLATSTKILNVIHRYRPVARPGSYDPEVDGAKFLAQIYAKVANGEPITMCLPAFPFKSPNSRDKVLGNLPDKAEEFALANLNGMCAAVQALYPAGATLRIISDGLVYNDLLGVPDKDVWAYGEGLRAMAAAKGFKHIEFSRLQDLVNIDLPAKLDEMTYVANATAFRMALLAAFGNENYNASLSIAESEDTCMTYRGYIRFLQTDLQHVYPLGEDRSKARYKKGTEYIAKQMLKRGDAFARAVRTRFGSMIRLSIHPSSGRTKIPVSPLATSSVFTTPWHCTIAFRLDGTVMTGQRAEFEADETLELVRDADGRPSFFLEKSELLNWGADKGGITVEPIYPSGWILRPAAGPKALSIADVDAAKVRALSERNSPVVLRGFAGTKSRDAFVAKSHEFGTPLPWKFGLVLEVKDRGADARGLNNVLSAEWMPYHYDGLFKTERRTNERGEEELISVPPRFQFFTAVTRSPPDTGFTLFATSRLVLDILAAEHGLIESRLRSLRWSVRTSAFDSTVLRNLPLVIDHPTTGVPCLRYHEPWPSTKTAFEETLIEVEAVDGAEPVDSAKICETIDSVLHDRRVSYYHSWEEGDLLVSDNILAMHTRSDFVAGCDRELWRIHFD